MYLNGWLALGARLGLEKDVKPLRGATGPGEETSGCEAACSAKGPAWRRAWSDAWAFFVPAVPYLLVGTAAGAAIYGLVPAAWVVARWPGRDNRSRYPWPPL